MFDLPALTPAEFLTYASIVIVTAGTILVLLGIASRTIREFIYQDRKLSISKKEQDPPESGNYIIYLNVLLPLIEDADVSGQIKVVSGKTRFRIVSYFGYPPPLPHGRWASNTYYPKDQEYVEIATTHNMPTLHLLKRDYVCEFRVGDEHTLEGFEVRFTAIVQRRIPKFQHSKGFREFGQLMVAVGISLLAVGLSALIRA